MESMIPKSWHLSMRLASSQMIFFKKEDVYQPFIELKFSQFILFIFYTKEAYAAASDKRGGWSIGSRISNLSNTTF